MRAWSIRFALILNRLLLFVFTEGFLVFYILPTESVLSLWNNESEEKKISDKSVNVDLKEQFLN